MIHPSDYITHTSLRQRKVRFVPITGSGDFLVRYPYYQEAFVPIRFYPYVTNVDDVVTIGQRGVLVATDRLSVAMAEQITGEMVDLVSELKDYDTILHGLPEKAMPKIRCGRLHHGAKRC